MNLASKRRSRTAVRPTLSLRPVSGAHQQKCRQGCRAAECKNLCGTCVVKVASFSCDNLIPIAPGPTVLESFIIFIANFTAQQEIN